MEHQQPAISEARAQWLWDEQEALIHRVCVSAAYHGRRERFFNLWERFLQAFTAITATAAFADLSVKDSTTTKWFLFLAAAASIVPLVANLAGNAQRHGQLKTGFKSLLATIYAAGTELTEPQILAFKSKVSELESGEPAPMPGVIILCQNEIAARERKAVYPLTIWERCWMHYYPFDGAEIVDRARRKAVDVAAPAR